MTADIGRVYFCHTIFIYLLFFKLVEMKGTNKIPLLLLFVILTGCSLRVSKPKYESSLAPES